MAERVPTLDDVVKRLDRGFFGYHRGEVDLEVERLHRDDHQSTQTYSDEAQRLTVELQRLLERKKTLGDLADHLQMECTHLHQQLNQGRINARFAEEGVRQEIERLRDAHRRRITVIEAAEIRTDLEAQGYEKNLWKIAESLTRVFQESQTVANQHLTIESPDTVWAQFISAALGEVIPPWQPEPMIAGFLERRRVPPHTIDVLERPGTQIGWLNAVILSHIPPAIVAYQIDNLGYVSADDVQVLRMRHITIRSPYRLLDEADVVSIFAGGISQEMPASKVPTIEEAVVQQESAPEHIPGVFHDTPTAIANHGAPIDDVSPDPVHWEPIPLVAHPKQPTPIADPKEESKESDRVDREDSPLDPKTATPTEDQNDAIEPLFTEVDPVVPGTDDHPIPDEINPAPFIVSDWPEPTWSDVLDSTPRPSDHTLPLPGIVETNPPKLAPRSTAPPALAEDDALPGLRGTRATIPVPTWTDREPDAHPQTQLVPATPPPRSEPSSMPLSSEEFGALDVRTFLYGKRVGQDIRDASGQLVAKTGDTITPELVDLVERTGHLPDLIVHMVF